MDKDSSTGTSYNFDNLPVLVYYHIFKYLNLADILEFRSISKTFYSNFKLYEIAKLSFLDSSFFLQNSYLFLTNKSTEKRNLIHTSKLGLLTNPSINLLNLKHLAIKNTGSQLLPMRLDDINKLTTLQVLELVKVDIGSSGLLKLPDLQALSFDSEVEEKLVIDTPNLGRLRMPKLSSLVNQVEFKHPLSVKHLQLDSHSQYVLIFKNLECLEYLISYTWLEADDLLDFKNLKSLKFAKNGMSHMSAARLKNLFESKKNDLDVVLSGVKIKSIDKIDEYIMYSVSLLRFHLHNKDDLEDTLDSVYEIYYNEWDKLLPDNHPSEIDVVFRKYTNIQSITIEGDIEAENRLINLIKECPNLYSLNTLYSSSLSQEFYDQLPEICSLYNFKTHDIDINLKFVKKMTDLVSLEISRDIKPGEDFDLHDLDDLKYLRKLSFYINHNQIVKISKKNEHKYTLFSYIGYLRDQVDVKDLLPTGQDHFSLDEIIGCIDALRKKIMIKDNLLEC